VALLLETGMDVVESLVLEKAEYLKAEIDKNGQLMLLSPRHAPLNSGIVIFKHRTVANEVLYQYLQDNGVVCAMRGGGIRFSPHFYNTTEEMAKALGLIAIMPLS